MISAVIVTYESATCVGRCIASLRDALPAAELIVIDNASRDDTISAVGAAAPQARVIRNPRNDGFGRACNRGAEAAHGSHVLFLNPDVVVTAVDHERLDALLTESPFGLAAPAFIGERGRLRADRAWPSELLTHTLATLRPREWRGGRPRDDTGHSPWVAGALLLVSRAEFLDLGGFDRRFFLYYEDRDLSRRYRTADLRIRTTEAIRARHTQGTSSALDGLRAAPMAWSLLGWIQYLYIHEGARRAFRAAHVSLGTLHAARAALRALAFLGWGRARRKTRQLDAVFDFLHRQVASGDTTFCPDAMRLIRRLA